MYMGIDKKIITKMNTGIKLLLTVLAMVLILGAAVQTEAKVKLNKKTAKLTVGKTVTLKMTGTKKKVKWSTSNKKVAAVKSNGMLKGKVTAKKAGKATITAKVGNKKYKCKVTVVKKTTNSKATDNKTTEQEKKETEKTTETTSPSEDTSKVDAGEYSINNVHTGEGTFYSYSGGGAASLGGFEEQYYTAAMNNEDYMNGLAGAYIEITDKDGDKINVLINDRLPEGKKGDIDLSKEAFLKIEPEATGRMNITWKIIPLPTKDPVQYVFKTGSSQYWAAVQVRNHKYPIAKFEYLDTNGNYVELPREEYNYFTAASGLGSGPYTFRVTDIYGHQIVDTGITMSAIDTPINGSANFPD